MGVNIYSLQFHRCLQLQKFAEINSCQMMKNDIYSDYRTTAHFSQLIYQEPWELWYYIMTS